MKIFIVVEEFQSLEMDEPSKKCNSHHEDWLTAITTTRAKLDEFRAYDPALEENDCYVIKIDSSEPCPYCGWVILKTFLN